MCYGDYDMVVFFVCYGFVDFLFIFVGFEFCEVLEFYLFIGDKYIVVMGIGSEFVVRIVW